MHLTDTEIKRLEAPAKGNRIYYDDEVKGLGVRVTAQKARSFVLNYRVGGIERRATIGSFPDWSVQAARKRAKEWKRKIDAGVDPLDERQKVRDAPTVKQLAEEFMGPDGHGPRLRPSSRLSYQNIIKVRIVPELGRMRVADVTRADVEKMHREVSREAPIRANRALAVLSRMMTTAIVRGYRADNPCKHVERNQENARQRYLSTAEISRLADALGKYGNPASADAVRFALLTGARKGEVVSARWADFDLTAGIWVKPSAHTKQKRDHRVPLSAPALELLNRRREAGADAEFVFPSSRKQGEPLQRLSACWDFVRKEAGLKDARVHDLRHCFASILVSGGASLPLIGQLLGHTQARTTLRYSHLHDQPLREGVDLVGRVVMNAATRPAKVLPIRGRK